jgi:hypothetical protein
MGLIPRVPLSIVNRRLSADRSESVLPFSSLESSRFFHAFQSLPLAVLSLHELVLHKLVDEGAHAVAGALGLHCQHPLQALADLPQAQALFQPRCAPCRASFGVVQETPWQAGWLVQLTPGLQRVWSRPLPQACWYSGR